jgi:tetratricopeptide (TPR) repeat protein
MILLNVRSRRRAKNFARAQVKEIKEAQLSAFLIFALRSYKSGADFYGIPRKKTRKLLQEFKNLKDFDKSYAKFRHFVAGRVGTPLSDPENMFTSAREQLAAVGVFSLSEVPDQPLMWAHYAGDHKGICIGFEITDASVLADADRCLRVDYKNSTPELSTHINTELSISIDNQRKIKTNTRLAFSDQSLKSAISTKGPEWDYEREWRYVEPIAGAYDWPAPIVEVTFGLRCPEGRRALYIKLAQQHVPNEVRFYEIKKATGTKSLTRERLNVSPNTADQNISTGSLIEVQRLLERRQFSTALPMIDRLISDGHESSELWRCKGIALGWSERHQDALDCFEKAINIDNENFSAWYQKGVALTQLKRYEEAIAAYGQTQKLYPYDPSITFNAGQILSHLQRFDEALAQLELAAKLGHPRAAGAIGQIQRHLNVKQ